MEARESEASERLWQPEYLERMIALNYDRDQQADLWHNAAEMFEANVEYPGHLDQAINCYRKAVELLLPGDERRAIFLHHLAAALMGRAESGVAAKSDIKLAIEAHIKALESTPEGDPYHAIFVANYGDAMMKLYYETGSSTDFEKGVELFHRALELADGDDPNRENWYTKLRDELYFRSEVTGEMKDLAKALEMHREDVPYNTQPAGRYQLAILLQKRHLATGSMLDLNEAFSVMDKLIVDCPKDDDHFGMILNVLGSLFRIRSRRLDPKHATLDCDRSIELQELALKWMKDHQKETPEARAICLSSLASALQRRYHVAEEDEIDPAVSETCLDRAILLFAEAAKVLPNNSPHLGNILGNQANAVMARYEKKKSPEDLNLGISTFESALKFQASEFQAQSLACLGRALAFRAKSSNLDSDWEAAIQTYERGTKCVDSPLTYRIMAADDGGNCIFHRDPHRASQLFTLAVKLLPAVSSRSLLRTDQQHNLSIFDGMVWSAVSACLETHDDVYKAIEVSEIGRGVIGNLQLDVSSDISDLGKEYPSHWKRLSEVRHALSSVQANWEDNTSPIASGVDRVRNLNEDFNSLLAEIRELENFGSFLRCPTEDELKDLAATGPIVIFSVSTFRSDALIITQQRLRSIPLKNLKYHEVLKHAQEFTEAINSPSARRYLESNRKLKKVLEWLWDAAVSPVLNELGYTDTPLEDGDWPRIWWVRAGVFSVLPIHAAGYHEAEPRTSTIDRVISSYAPTIKALAHAKNSLRSVCTEEQKILVVGMSKTPDQDDLPAEQEINELKKILPSNISTTFKANPDRKEILDILRQTEIFHFTGHGLSSASDPSQSCLLLKDWKAEPLSVANLRSLKIPNGQFAYLSACHSGTSINAGLWLLDESLHISTAFQLAGFRSVVATLWYVYADYSITVAKQLYSSMMGQSTQIQPGQSAMALHHTVRRLRDELRKVPGIRAKGPDNPLIWAAYIHTGW